MDIHEFFKKHPCKDVWESNIEEHNRYIKPPKGLPIVPWVLGLLRNKYEFGEHTKSFKDLLK